MKKLNKEELDIIKYKVQNLDFDEYEWTYEDIMKILTELLEHIDTIETEKNVVEILGVSIDDIDRIKRFFELNGYDITKNKDVLLALIGNKFLKGFEK